MRVYKPGFYAFGFDQVQILKAAAEIRGGHPLLIGPRTGPAGMFTGPLVYYLATFFTLFLPLSWVIVAIAVSIYIVTFWALAWMVHRYVTNKNVEFFVLLIYAFSVFQVMLDRIPWNPDLTLLASALVFFPLLSRRKIDRIDLLSIAAGSFLGFQAHFSGLVLPIMILVLGLWRRQIRPFAAALVGLGVSLLPTFVFDLRHDWLNLHGFISLLTENKDKPLGLFEFIGNGAADLLRMLENGGRLLLYHPPLLISVVMMSVLLYVFWRLKPKRDWLQAVGVWLVVLNLVFLFYHGEKPEYYFLLQFPALIYVYAVIADSIIGIKLAKLLVLPFFLISFLVFQIFAQPLVPPMSIGNQIRVTGYVREYLRRNPDGLVVFDTPGVEGDGLKYLLSDLPAGEASASAHPIHIIYPVKDEVKYSVKFDGIAVEAK